MCSAVCMRWIPVALMVALLVVACVAPLQSVAPEDSIKARPPKDARLARIRIAATDPLPSCRFIGPIESGGSYQDADDAETRLQEEAADRGANYIVVGEYGTDRDPTSRNVRLRGRAFDCPAEAFGTTKPAP